ncbi:MAG TPA: PAS domain-containing protein [Rhodoferax sp.]|jgi:PAS domain S-box-containing protein|nr:PAS domain-containing protein [Rhodoferax sp.]HQC84767.1 PAS domain-containing protein [Rhodoferax sp.]
MKYDVEPTLQERVMREDDFLVSKTDLKGRITYGNRIFIEFSGYDETELLGAQHNIVRHPDMPRGVFKFLWDTIQSKQECFAYVKNMSKDGGFYWVFANVTPSFDAQGQMDGYFSVRRKPRQSAVDLVSRLYAQMLDAENKAGSRDACTASINMLTDLLNEKGMSYEAFILSI